MLPAQEPVEVLRTFTFEDSVFGVLNGSENWICLKQLGKKLVHEQYVETGVWVYQVDNGDVGLSLRSRPSTELRQPAPGSEHASGTLVHVSARFNCNNGELVGRLFNGGWLPIDRISKGKHETCMRQLPVRTLQQSQQYTLDGLSSFSYTHPCAEAKFQMERLASLRVSIVAILDDRLERFGLLAGQKGGWVPLKGAAEVVAEVVVSSSLRRNAENDRDCIICMSELKTHGLLHGDSVHFCLCEGCSRRIGYGTCPVCRRSFERIVRVH